MRRSVVRRPGFTLIELLVVILVIGILASISFGMFKAATDSRNRGKSRGDIQAISVACQSYRKAYGDFPVCASGTDDSFRRDLFDQLVGRRVIRIVTVGTAPQLLDFDSTSLPGGTTRLQRPFLGVDDITTNDDSAISANDWRGGSAACREIIDAWGNPYDYRYRALGRFTDWKSPNFLLVSCGVKFVEPTAQGLPPPANEYWDPSGTMTRSGIVPPTYFDETGAVTGPFRADNLVNWTN
jgi:prepilin-type N-terminal cleavage/methylation domain-containing protein